MYISETYISNIMSPGVLSGTLVYGGTTTATTGSVLAQFITGSCGYVDSFLQARGYTLPLSPVPAIVQELAAYKTVERLYQRANKGVPDNITFNIRDSQAELLEMAIAKGILPAPGVAEDNVASAAGGHSVTPNSVSAGDPRAPVFSREDFDNNW